MTTQHDSTDAFSDFSELMSQEYEEDPADRVARRRRRRRGWLATAIVFGLILAGAGGYTAWALDAPLPDPVVALQEPEVPTRAATALSLPADGSSAISVSGADAYLGETASGVWATSGTDEPRPIASISKLITALVVLDAHPLDSVDDPGPTITFSKADHDLYDEYYVQGATIVEMPTGSSLSERDALATMLVPSASNYAEAVSTWAFGSQGAFVQAARAWLDANGLAGTTLVEPTGMSPRNTSTPGDLLAIAKLAASHPVITAITASSSVSPPGLGTLYNTNKLLGTAGITGLKTGNLGEGTFNLLYTATLDVGTGEPLSVTGVILGGRTREGVNAAVITLLSSIRGGFEQVPLAEPGQEVGTFTTPWGSSARLVTGGTASILTWSDTAITMDMQTTAPTAYADGEEIGSITWSAGPNTASVPLEIDGTIEPPTDWWRLTHPDQLVGP